MNGGHSTHRYGEQRTRLKQNFTLDSLSNNNKQSEWGLDVHKFNYDSMYNVRRFMEPKKIINYRDNWFTGTDKLETNKGDYMSLNKYFIEGQNR